jgi:hypothetical protein
VLGPERTLARGAAALERVEGERPS